MAFVSLPCRWLNTVKYVLLDKFKAIKFIPYMEQEVQNSGTGSTNQKLHKLPCSREYSRECGSGGGDMHPWETSKSFLAVSSTVEGVLQNTA